MKRPFLSIAATESRRRLPAVATLSTLRLNRGQRSAVALASGLAVPCNQNRAGPSVVGWRRIEAQSGQARIKKFAVHSPFLPFGRSGLPTGLTGGCG